MAHAAYGVLAAPAARGCPDRAACLAALTTAGPVRPAVPVVTGATGPERAPWPRG